jgi:hypothetical protein
MDEIAIQAPADLQKRLIYFVCEYLNRGFRVRDAVSAGVKAMIESYGESANVRLTEEAFEKTVVYFEAAIEKYRAEQEKGAAPVSNGIYVEAVGDDEYRERTQAAKR